MANGSFGTGKKVVPHAYTYIHGRACALLLPDVIYMCDICAEAMNIGDTYAHVIDIIVHCMDQVYTTAMTSIH